MNRETNGLRLVREAKAEYESARKEVASLSEYASASRAERAANRLKAARTALNEARAQLVRVA